MKCGVRTFFLRAAVIGREITMSALREWAASTSPEAYAAVAVSQWGKWKTASQVHYSDPTLTLHSTWQWDLLDCCYKEKNHSYSNGNEGWECMGDGRGRQCVRNDLTDLDGVTRNQGPGKVGGHILCTEPSHEAQNKPWTKPSTSSRQKRPGV
jgi:hypothetical protein